jgi:hypothetical protein
VLRDLSVLSLDKELSFGRRRCSILLQTLLVSEIAIAKSRSHEKVMVELKAIFSTICGVPGRVLYDISTHIVPQREARLRAGVGSKALLRIGDITVIERTVAALCSCSKLRN